MGNRIYHCWYSQEQANLPGVAINQYRLTTGELVTVTEVSETPKCPNLWPDCQYLGETEYPGGFVKHIRKPNEEGINLR